MRDLIYSDTVIDAVQVWIDTDEYKEPNYSVKLLQRLNSIPRLDLWIEATKELPIGVDGYEPCMLVNVLGVDGVKGCGYYNELSEEWYLLLDTPDNYLMVTRDKEYVAYWRPLPDRMS